MWKVKVVALRLLEADAQFGDARAATRLSSTAAATGLLLLLAVVVVVLLLWFFLGATFRCCSALLVLDERPFLLSLSAELRVHPSAASPFGCQITQRGKTSSHNAPFGSDRGA